VEFIGAGFVHAHEHPARLRRLSLHQRRHRRRQSEELSPIHWFHEDAPFELPLNFRIITKWSTGGSYPQSPAEFRFIDPEDGLAKPPGRGTRDTARRRQNK